MFDTLTDKLTAVFNRVGSKGAPMILTSSAARPTTTAATPSASPRLGARRAGCCAEAAGWTGAGATTGSAKAMGTRTSYWPLRRTNTTTCQSPASDSQAPRAL